MLSRLLFFVAHHLSSDNSAGSGWLVVSRKSGEAASGRSQFLLDLPDGQSVCQYKKHL
jgi:hypothetical protein